MGKNLQAPLLISHTVDSFNFQFGRWAPRSGTGWLGGGGRGPGGRFDYLDGGGRGRGARR